jgi:hypothetical protein
MARWGENYETVLMKAKKLGISKSTYHRRQWQNAKDPIGDMGDINFFNRASLLRKPSARSSLKNQSLCKKPIYKFI